MTYNWLCVCPSGETDQPYLVTAAFMCATAGDLSACMRVCARKFTFRSDFSTTSLRPPRCWERPTMLLASWGHGLWSRLGFGFEGVRVCFSVRVMAYFRIWVRFS